MINFIGNNKGVLFSSYYCSYFSNKNFFRSFSTSFFLRENSNDLINISNSFENNDDIDSLNIKYNEPVSSIFSSNVFKNDVFKLIYNNLSFIMKNNPVNKDTQLKIENFLFNQFKSITEEKLNQKVLISDVDFNIFNSKFKEFCFDKVDEFNIHLNKLRISLNNNNKYKDINKLKNKTDIHSFFIKEFLNKLDNNVFINSMFYIIFLVVTFNNMVLEDDITKKEEKTKIGLTKLALIMGKNITRHYITTLYKELKQNNTEIKFSEFKEGFLGENNQNVIVTSEFYLDLSGKLLDIIFVCNILEKKVKKINTDSDLTILKLTEEVDKLVEKKNSLAVLPMDLPMIVEPKDFTKKEIGGYLLNDLEYDDQLIGNKIGYKNNSIIDDNNIIYNSVNNIMKTPFKVNKVLLDYLLKNNEVHKLLVNSDYIHKFSLLEKRTKIQEKEYQRFLSKNMLEKYVLLIADLFSNIPEIFFPLKMDQRGRIYPRTSFFHYQGSELAKALILFARPDIIKRSDLEAIEYLKAYGASCFGNGLNRKSYTKRVEWVDKNTDKIVNFDSSDLVSKADEKFLFLAFCFEFKRFITFLNNVNMKEFKTYLPIQLDGTCNGFQHLALLSNETELYSKLNLAESNKNKDPIDFYAHILDLLSIHLEYQKKNCKSIDNIESINRLLNLGMSRSTIKPVIMNKPYNARNRTLISYIKDTLIFDHIEKCPELDEKGLQIYKDGKASFKNISWYKISENSLNYVNHKDLDLLVKSIDEIIYVKYPKIKELTEYFKGIAKIFNRLDLPIIWRLPHGLMVSQKYMEKRSIQVYPFTFSSSSLTLTIIDKIKIDKDKQVSAFMPNLVHSLDAASLTLLYNSFYNTIKGDTFKNVNFYSVHDCYGVTANYVNLLIQMLRSVYILIYSGKGYIEKFDEDVINDIIKSQGEDKCIFDRENRIITINKRKKIKLPDLSKFLNVPNKDRAYESLSKSIFLIK